MLDDIFDSEAAARLVAHSSPLSREKNTKLLLVAEAALDGGSKAVHGLACAADPLADREDHTPKGRHTSPWC